MTDSTEKRTSIAGAFAQALSDFNILGTWKLTAPGRLPETEAALCRLFEKDGDSPPIHWLDMGASDGSTTLDMAAALNHATGRPVRSILADRFAILRCFRFGPLREYRTAEGAAVFVCFKGVGLRLPKAADTWDWPSTALAWLYLHCGFIRRRLKPAGEVSLVSPAVQMDPDVEVIEMDCLKRVERLRDTLDAVRLSNVLNRVYFADDEIRLAVSNVVSYLKEGGCLIVSRNDQLPGGEIERGSVWRAEAGRLTLIEEFGGGSDVGDLVAAAGDASAH